MPEHGCNFRSLPFLVTPSNMRFLAQIFAFALASHVAIANIQVEPATFQPNPRAGPGGSSFKESPRFRVYNCNEARAVQALNLLEAAYTCMVGEMGWRSSGLSFNLPTDANGPYYKMNAYCVATGASIG